MNTFEWLGLVLLVGVILVLAFGKKIIIGSIITLIASYLIYKYWGDNGSFTFIFKVVGVIVIVGGLSMLAGGFMPLFLFMGIIGVAAAWFYHTDKQSGGGWTALIYNEAKKNIPALPNIQLPTVDQIKSQWTAIMPVAPTPKSSRLRLPNNCKAGERVYGNSPIIEVQEGPQVARLCDIAPTQSCLKGCVYSITSTESSDICQTTTQTIKVIEEHGSDGKDYMYYQGWWVSTGQACGMEMLR